ncbi:Gfo/Idh/MocA family protein [Thalassospira povalilytica]|uniref:Gfo/Idh/MocA family protein n=1 Tax=Thalassospira povalilytica TaxID=732237 RepID=UPI003AA880A9
MLRFGLIGAAGFVAPRHMAAIKDTGNTLIVAEDPNDSVGVIDSYFPEAKFFTEFERFDRYVDKLRRSGSPLDCVSVCSPNYLHDAHVRFGLRSGADVICEKPLVLNPWNIDGLADIERESGKRINSILQLRLHPSIVELKKKIDADNERVHDVDLTYITSRGSWYHSSWKGNEAKSGGVATNIGVHFFDMLVHVFGRPTRTEVHLRDSNRVGGYLELEKARVRWFMSVAVEDLPEGLARDQRTFRSISVNSDEFEFSGGFTDLHTESYRKIIAGNGFTLQDSRAAIELVSGIRSCELLPRRGDVHPFAQRYLQKSIGYDRQSRDL